MAFIDDKMAVVSDQIGDDTLPNQALHQGDINDSGRLLLPAMDDPEATRRDVEKRLEVGRPEASAKNRFTQMRTALASLDS